MWRTEAALLESSLSLLFFSQQLQQTRFLCLLWLRGSDVWKREDCISLWPVMLPFKKHRKVLHLIHRCRPNWGFFGCTTTQILHLAVNRSDYWRGTPDSVQDQWHHSDSDTRIAVSAMFSNTSDQHGLLLKLRSGRSKVNAGCSQWSSTDSLISLGKKKRKHTWPHAEPWKTKLENQVRLQNKQTKIHKT